MRVIDKYLLREAIVPFLIGTGAVVIMLLGGILYDNAWIFRREVPILAVLQLLVLRAPYLLWLTLPVGTVVAASLVISRVTRDSEMTVIRSAGVPIWRICLPLIIASIFVTGFDFVLAEKTLPSTQLKYQKLMYQILMMQPQPTIMPNIAIQVKNMTITIGSADRSGNLIRLRDIKVAEQLPNGMTTFITAQTGTYDAGKWVLKNVWVYQPDTSGNIVSVRSENETIINVRADFGQFYVPPPAEAMSMKDLSKSIENKRKYKQNTQEDEVSYHSKIALPFASFILSILASVLAIRFSRSGSFIGVLLSIILIFVYWNTHLLFGKILGANGFLNPVIAAWTPNLLFILCGLILMRKAEFD